MTETRFYVPARLSTPVKPLSFLSKVFRFNSWLAAVRHVFYSFQTIPRRIEVEYHIHFFPR